MATDSATGRGLPEMRLHIGMINVRSMILAPMIFPTPSDDCFLITAVMVVTSSGRDVPIAMIVTEITLSLMPKDVAIMLPLSTNRSAPKTIASAPSMNFNIFEKITAFVFDSGPSFSSLPPLTAFTAARILSTKAITKIMSRSMLVTVPIPSIFPAFAKLPTTTITMAAPSIRRDFSIYSFLFIIEGMQIMPMAIIRPVLAVTLPMALPIAISTLPSCAAMAETSNSGSVVARLTTVAPTISLGIPDTSAIHVAASTNTSPPFTIRTIPTASITAAGSVPPTQKFTISSIGIRQKSIKISDFFILRTSPLCVFLNIHPEAATS